jgi:hypothetical protein
MIAFAVHGSGDQMRAKARNSLPARRPLFLVIWNPGYLVPGGLGFGALQRAPHPHCPRPANPTGLLIRARATSQAGNR